MNTHWAPAVWTAGALVVLIAATFANFPGPGETSVPAGLTPMDRTLGSAAAMWRLLGHASGCLPPGASYTVRASDRKEEMALYMMSLGVLVRNTPMPSSYYHEDLEAHGRQAGYMIVYQNQIIPGPSYRLVLAVPDGVVYRREGRP